MTFAQLMKAGGWAKSIKGPGGKRNVGWTMYPPNGFRFSKGGHDLVMTTIPYGEELGEVNLERCGPGCSCRRAGRQS